MKTLFIIVISLFLVACDQSNKMPVQSSALVAKVGNEFITQDQVMNQVVKLTGLQFLTEDQAMIRASVIDSMVLAKLMAQKQKAMMSEDDLSELEQEVMAYREERLAQRYLAENITTQPPSAHEIESFYQKNLHRFGGGIFAHINKWQLGSDCQLDEQGDKKSNDFKVVLKNLVCDKTQVFEIILLSQLARQSDIKASDIKVDEPIWRTKNKGQTITFVERIEKRSAKSLVEVASDVRKMLAPMQFKAAISNKKAQLLKEMDVEIFDN